MRAESTCSSRRRGASSRPAAPPREGATGTRSCENYEGGWQELFPSCNDPCAYRGVSDPLPRRGGDRARGSVERRRDGEVRLRCRVDCRPDAVRAGAHDAAGRATALVLEETRDEHVGRAVRSSSGATTASLGPPFLQPGCRLELPARTIVTIPELWEETARLEPGTALAWPDARLAGRAARSTCARPRARGERATTTSTSRISTRAGSPWRTPRSGCTFALAWDPDVFPLADLLAALRRGGGDAARRLLRAGRRAVGDPARLAEAVRAERGFRARARRLAPDEADRDDRKRRMAAGSLPGRRQGLRRRDARRRRPRPRGGGRRVHGLRRAVRLREDDRAPDGRRPRGDHRGRDPDRRPRRERRSSRGSATSRWSSRTTRSTRT